MWSNVLRGFDSTINFSLIYFQALISYFEIEKKKNLCSNFMNFNDYVCILVNLFGILMYYYV